MGNEKRFRHLFQSNFTLNAKQQPTPLAIAMVPAFYDPARSDPVPTCGDQYTEGRICTHKDPGRCLVVQDGFQPMRDERAGINRPTRLLTQRHLPDGEGTNGSQPGLEYHEPNGRDVRIAEPRISYPFPGTPLAQQDKDQPKDYEHDEAEMHQQNGVSRKQVER